MALVDDGAQQACARMPAEWHVEVTSGTSSVVPMAVPMSLLLLLYPSSLPTRFYSFMCQYVAPNFASK